MKGKDISIILVNYNNYLDTKEILYCIENQIEKPGEVIVVDNCSTDSSFNDLQKEFSNNEDYKIIKSEYNGGFSYANNWGIKYSLSNSMGISHYMLLNNDTIVGKDFIQQCCTHFIERDDIGIYTGKILNYNTGRIWYGGGRIGKIYLSGLHKYMGRDSNYPKANEVGYQEFSSGCFMLIPKRMFEMDLFLPEEYFLYYEDVDYSLNMKKLGLKIIYNPNVVLYHKISSTTNKSRLSFMFYFNRNRIILCKKYYKKTYQMFFLTFLLITRSLLFLKTLILEKKVDNVFKGIREGLNFNAK